MALNNFVLLDSHPLNRSFKYGTNTGSHKEEEKPGQEEGGIAGGLSLRD